ncbi:flagellar hook-length control protein FliK [Piscinibacter terrae]|uniref:Flagellar hook-length control protein FliK n=1 Tax=Piscinibacter terrae TaxID=2496871 RepID=A0A3N7HTY1_9BURK|nr:flagellar hook-length control protein FliK [Albitalea terrae]RQP25253.1 flagellar hook-length control protein FliK [Albitalea terrae]
MQIASTSNASPLPFTPATPSANGAQGEDNSFAKMLAAQKQPAERPPEVQSHQEEPKKPETAEKKADASDEAAPSEDTSASEEACASARRGPARNQPKLAAKGRDSTIGKLGHAAKPEAADAAKVDAKPVAETKDDKTEPGTAELAAQMNPAPQPAAPVPAGTAASTDGADAAVKLPALPGGTQAAAPTGASLPTPAVGDKQDKPGIGTADAKKESPFARALASESQQARPAEDAAKLAVGQMQERIEQPHFELPGVREAGAAGHVGGVHSPIRQEVVSSAPVAVDVPTPVTSPDFPETLGVQVSVLARDGVQHAELHLNPAEMGPISVQIALDGTRAQVDFGADSMTTRQIIESGLPELASALRDAGFTLAGGGVSQHSASQGQGDRDGSRQGGSNGSRRISGPAETAAPVRRATVKMSQGGVDLYA